MTSLLSPDWYRVAFMRPRLRSGVTVSRQQVRGRTWYLLSDPMSGRHHRFNDIAYSLIASCNGERTLDEVWVARVEAEGDNAPTQDDTIALVSQAFGANLFTGDIAPDAARVVQVQSRAREKRRRGAINPLSFRVPVWDPDGFLDRHVEKLGGIFNLAGRRLAWLFALFGALLLALNAAEFSAQAARDLSAPRMLLLMWLVYPLIKAVHELAHAFAVKAFGGAVHELGITLLLLTPVPYVDASASAGFADKRQRVAVDAAGMLAEALIATVAMIFWLVLEPGLTRDLAFAVVFIGLISTLLVNGNPLLRFDGYHLLCDALELPSLGTRSSRYWHFLFKRFVLRLPRARFADIGAGERPWLLAYAPLSFVWRTALLLLLAVALAQASALLGLAVLALGAWSTLGAPAVALGRWVCNAPELRGHRLRAGTLAGVGAGLLAVTLFALPLAHRTQAAGIVWLPDEALVRPAVDGFIDEWLLADGAPVAAGTPIARLGNEPLRADLERVQALLLQKELGRDSHFSNDAMRNALAADEIERLQAEAARLSQQVDELTVRAGRAGRLARDSARHPTGRWLARGELLAQVIASDTPPLVRALVRNEDVDLLRQTNAGMPASPQAEVSVMLAHAGGAALPGTVVATQPQPTQRLPSEALGDAAGGPIALDPADASGRTAREVRFEVDLHLPAGSDARVGARALVSFRHGDTTAAMLIARFVRQSFLRHFRT